MPVLTRSSQDSGNLETQQKAHLAYNNVDMSKQYLNQEKLDNKCATITLNEGDILYHPAGVWHSVTSTDDSISINFSMKALRMGEFVS